MRCFPVVFCVVTLVALGSLGCDEAGTEPGSLEEVESGESAGIPTGNAGRGLLNPSDESGSSQGGEGTGWGDNPTGGGTDGTGGTSGGATGGGSAAGADYCNDDADCPAEEPHCSVSGLCFECITAENCGSGEVCTGGICLPSSCSPGESACSGDSVVVCDSSGSSWTPIPCPGENGTCVDGACQGCEPGTKICLGKDEVLVCGSGALGFTTESCGADGFCVEGACAECYPGTHQCAGDWAQTCSELGFWENAQDCSLGGGECTGGACLSSCGLGGKLSNEGCDYWVVDMDNKGPAADSPYAVIVSNLNTSAVSITISSQADAQADPVTVASGNVAPGQLEVFELPQQNMGSTGVFWKALRLQASGPIVAYQFNPLENVGVYSNDASLLLPSNTFGTEYVVVSREEIPSNEYGSFRGSISIVTGTADTEVMVQAAGVTLGGSGIPKLQPGEMATVVIQPYQVLNIQSDELGTDLTGTLITSDKPIGVFGGHEAAVGNEQCCADHLEQQLFPVATWGKNYVATKSQTRGVEKDYWRIVASQEGTSVSLSPSLPGIPNPILLGRGEFYEFQTAEDFVIDSNLPVMVAQTLPSSAEITGPVACSTTSECADGYSCSWVSPECMADTPYCSSASECPNSHSCRCGDLGFCTCEPLGDPAMILAAPVEQYRSSYVFLTPTNFVEDYVNIIAPNGATVTLDGTDVPSTSFQAIGDGAYRVARSDCGGRWGAHGGSQRTCGCGFVWVR